MKHLVRFLFLLILVSAGSVVTSASPASAHGEPAQEAFIKTGTVAWSDVKWSTNRIKVGQAVTMTGRLTLMTDWPGKMARPENTEAYLNANAPGPVFIVTDRQLGGEFVPGRMKLERGKTYDFKVTVVGRRPGRWHLHPMISFKTVGPLIGPGQYIQVDDGPKFVNKVELASGKVVNLETYGRGTVLWWQLFALLPGAAWLVYWLVPRPLLYRAKLLATGQDVEEELVGPRERRFGVYTVGAIAIILVVGSLWSKSAYPDQIPQQIRRHAPKPVELVRFMKAESAGLVRYSPAEEKITWPVKLTNTGSSPYSVREFTTSTVTFGVPGTGQEYSLVVPDDTPIAPGETRTVTLVMADSVWETARLISLTEVAAALSGLLIVEDTQGTREALELTGEMTLDRGR